jgi:hypothetical protein
MAKKTIATIAHNEKTTRNRVMTKKLKTKRPQKARQSFKKLRQGDHEE